MTTDRPDIVIITSDQHNARVLGAAGDAVVATPALDRLAEEGAMLERNYCPSPLCVPSRMSMLTGRTPTQNRVWSLRDTLSSAIPTFAHALGAVGYRTHLIGKLHAIGPDQLMGFGSRSLGDHGPSYPGAPQTDRGAFNGAGPTIESLEHVGRGQSAYQIRDELVAAEARHFLERVAIERRAGTARSPFCLSLGLLLPHAPYVARAEDYDLYDGRVPAPSAPEPFGDDLHPFLHWWRLDRGAPDVDEETTRIARTAYWAMVHRMDIIIGGVLDSLERLGLAEDTLVVYTSDHGDQIGEHGLWWKHVLYEDSVRVPTILRWPGRIPAGRRVSQVSSALDVTATVLAAAEAPPLPASPGRDLIPMIRGDEEDWEDVATSEAGLFPVAKPQRMVRRDRWKLTYYHGAPLQLFDLDTDPHERIDLADDPAHADTRGEMLALLFQDWDPDEIAGEMQQHLEEQAILAAWGRNVAPPEPYRFDMPPTWTYLDSDDAGRTGGGESSA
ncbi:sulfatase-like hydrolase/transferase [Agromyces sp. SYSU T00194]|uniref:sulfatase-like hydrolase/transferase n=1 Tax=Agromyces chitinivorans TaxID=3158560 RepID=UPI00339B480E